MTKTTSLAWHVKQRELGASRDPSHADTITMNHLIHLQQEVQRLLGENTQLKDKVWLLEQELKRIEHDRLVLEPFVEILERKRWLYDNPEALAGLEQGIADAKAGRLHFLGDFSQYLNDEDWKEDRQAARSE